MRNKCNKYIVTRHFGYAHDEFAGYGIDSIAPGGRERAWISINGTATGEYENLGIRTGDVRKNSGGRNPDKVEAFRPFWIGACSISFADAIIEKKFKVVINLDPDAGTYSCGKDGKYGGGKAKTTLDKK